MKAPGVFILIAMAIMQECLIGQNASDIGLNKKMTSFDAYKAAINDTLPRLEPLFQSYKDALTQGDQVQQKSILHQIVLRNTLENWRWQFYQYGQENQDKLSDRERAAWQIVNQIFSGQTVPPEPEDMLKMPPEKIYESIVQEKKAFDEVMAQFEQSTHKRSNSVSLFASELETETTSTTPVPSANKMNQQPKSAASPMPAETQSSPGFPIVPVAIVGAVIVGIVLYLLRRKST